MNSTEGGVNTVKKKALFFVALLCLFILPVFTCAYANNLPEGDTSQSALGSRAYGSTDEIKESQFVLPASVVIIEDEAFEGTAITDVVLPENVVTIGDFAFANIQTLRNISIPNSTIYIGKNAFKGSNNVVITGAPKGYARAWAHENGIPFNPITSFYAFNNIVQVNGGLTNSRAERLDIDSEKTEEEKPKPTGRMTGELNAEKKETITAFHVQGRSPPMV